MTEAKPASPHRPLQAMWGGRIEGAPADVMQTLNASLDFDRRLAMDDIDGSLAHCRMLAAQGIVGKDDARRMCEGLETIRREIREERFPWRLELEDVHMNIEARLTELVGSCGGRLQTARSRNDQVATDLRLWVRRALGDADAATTKLQATLCRLAAVHAATLMPGFTHMQTAQPVTFGHHLLCYVEMFGRDRKRLAAAAERLDECPLGAAALAGTSFPIDRRHTARALGFARPMANSMDAVSDRDFVLDFLATGAIAAVHLSRLAEELVLWSSSALAFVRLGDGWTTGSSLMPQKRNPDAAELIRARCGAMTGYLQMLLVALKALPLAYAKDLQEDKPPLFAAADNWLLCLAAMDGMFLTLKVDKARMAAQAASGYATATDAADWLVRTGGLPFRRAHFVVGRLVALAEKEGVALHELSLEAMREVEPAIDAGIYEVLDAGRAVVSRTSLGGTAPERVARAVVEAVERWGLKVL